MDNAEKIALVRQLAQDGAENEPGGKKRDGGSDEMKDAEKLALIRKMAERGREICDDPGLQVDTLLECVIMVIDAEEVLVE